MKNLARLSILALLGALALPAWGQVPISGLPAATTPPSGSEVFPVVQGGVTKKMPIGSLPNSGVTAGTYGDATHCATVTFAASGLATGASQSTSCPGGGGGAVSSVFGRTGAVTATSGDYSVGQVTGAAPTASPTFTGTVTIPNGGVFGVPTSVTLTNGTGLPISTGVSGLGAGVATALGQAVSGTGSICLTTGSACGGGGGGGTVTTSGSPANGNLAKFSGSTVVTNGDLSGDCVTTGTLAINCTKTGGVSFAPSATTDTTIASNIASGTIGAARLPLATTGAFGAVKPDGTTITISGGVISSTGGAAVSVTSASSNIIINPTPGVSTFTVGATYLVRAVSGTTDSITCATDGGKLVLYSNAGTKAITVPQATGSCGAGASFDVQNSGAGSATFTPATSMVNGGTTLVVAQNRGCTWVSDGANWQVAQCTALLP